MAFANPEYLIYGAAGAASLELLKLYDYRDKLSGNKYRALLRSPLYWLIVAGMLAASGFIAWAMNADKSGIGIWQVVATGIAARSIVRELVATKEATSPTKLGARAEPDRLTSLRDIFQ